VDAIDASRAGQDWELRWRIANDGARPVRIISAVLPHAGFRAAERSLDVAVPPGASADVSLAASFAAAPGAVVENPFVILTVDDGGERWRVLARLRVVAGPDAEPRPQTRLVTTQRVGFSTQR